VPGRPTPDIEVGAEAQGMHRRADHSLDRLEATEVDDRDNFFATSEKLWPRLETTFGDPFNSLAKFSAKNPSIAARPCAVSRSPRATTSPSLRMVRSWVSSSKCARKPASRSFRISIKNTDFGIQEGAAGSKLLGRSRWNSGDRREASGRRPRPPVPALPR
jgi:hypothetical protein